MTAPKGSKDLILVNCQEVPESIFVETRFVSQSANQKNTDKVYFTTTMGSFDISKDDQSLSVSKTPTITVAKSTPISPAANFQHMQPASSFASPINNVLNNLSSSPDLLRPAVANQVNNSVPSFKLNTLARPLTQLGNFTTPNISNITRSLCEKIQQTDISTFNKNSIGIQCALDDELDVEWPVENENCSENKENFEDEKENFLQFVKNNSTQHKNFKECLICGELCKSNKYFYGHMAIHSGPKVLCFKCGQCLEHKNLLTQHRCQKAKQLEKSFLKCPHFSCNVNAISLLELYDHINEHTNTRIYKCSACRKGFCTGQEYLRHILIRAKCFTSAKRKRFRVYGLDSQRDLKCRVRVFTLHTYKKSTILVKSFLTQRDNKQGLCKICLKSFSNKSVYNRHRQICINSFKGRLMRRMNVN